MERRYILRQNGVAILGISLCLYFAYHLIQGERSYLRLIGLRQAITRQTETLGDLKQQEDKLQRRVDRLRPGSIDRDFLEERVRGTLGYRAPEDRDVAIDR